MKNIIDGFYRPQQIAELYPDIGEVYKTAFAGEPWYEVSTCRQPNLADSQCNDGLSPLPIGQLCTDCNQCTLQPAYTTEALVEKFTAIAAAKETDWYIEMVDNRIAVSALAWVSDARTIATEKYANNPAMEPWLQENLPEQFIWVDEVFADKQVRPTGNLVNFSSMVAGFAERLQNSFVAYRTITPLMVAAGRRIGGLICEPGDGSQLPDRRSFVRINTANKV